MPQNTPLNLYLSPLADADMRGIWLYRAETWSFDQADRYTDSLKRTFETLRHMPDIAREHTEIGFPVRIHPSAEHLVIYVYDANKLTVIRVLGQRQDWRSILQG